MRNFMISACLRLLPGPFRALLGRVEASSLASRIARGSFWTLAGSVTSRGLALTSAILAARILGKTSYGELGVIQSTVGMFGTLAGFGMGTTASKFVGEFRLKDPAKAGRIIALSSIVSWSMSGLLGLALFLMSPWLCRSTLAAPQLTGCLQIGILLLVLIAVNGAQSGVLTGFEAFKKVAAVNTIAGLLNFPAVVVGALLFGLPGMIWGMILAQAGGCVLNSCALRREAVRQNVPISYSSGLAEVSVIWQFSIPAVLGSLMMGLVSWACTALLVRQPHGYDEMGALNAANQWFNALMWVPYALGGVALPMLAERFGANDQVRSTRLLITSIKINATVTFPPILVGCVGSRYIMAAYGKEFGGEWPTLIVALVTAGVLALQIPIGEIIAASGRMWVGFFMNVGWSLVFLVGTWALLSRGSFGFSSARLLAYVAQAICAFLFAVATIRNLGQSKGT